MPPPRLSVAVANPPAPKARVEGEVADDGSVFTLRIRSLEPGREGDGGEVDFAEDELEAFIHKLAEARRTMRARKREKKGTGT
jgi:hypothetical protein